MFSTTNRLSSALLTDLTKSTRGLVSLSCLNCSCRLNSVRREYSMKIDRRQVLCHAKISIQKQHPILVLGHQRFFSSSSDDGTGDKSQQIRVLPRRLIKRLEKQGISQLDFLAKLNSLRNASEQLTSTWDEDPAFIKKERPNKRSESYTGSVEDLENLLKSMSASPKLVSDTHDDFPSDLQNYRRWEKIEESKISKPKIDPSQMSVVLFPGQGSQFVGMGKKLLSFPGVKDLYEEASSVLGYDLLHMCLEGPKTELDKTVYCQPAVMITSLAAIEKLREEHPKAIENCVATAGFSVGEFAALVFSGVISFPDAVKVVKVRAQAMQRASEQVGSGMMSIFLAHDSDLKGAMKMAREYCQTRCDIEDPVCTVANYLFPECKVIAGHEEALEFITANAKEFRLLRCKRLPVSGAFHTQLMASARVPLEQAFQGMKLGTPKIPIYSNVTNAPYHAKSSFPHLLSKQVVSPVKWEQILQSIYKRPQGTEFPHTYEVGPGKQMGTLLKQVNQQGHKLYHNVEV